MEARIVYGECSKCADFCTEYNNSSYHELTQTDKEEAEKDNVCAYCGCSKYIHVKYAFESIREWEAYQNICNLYRDYGMSKALDASVADTEKLQFARDNYTYGEISFISFQKILRSAQSKAGDIFYDLGCGAGKPVAYAAFAFAFSKCVGIEQLPHVCELGKKFADEYAKGVETKRWKHTNYNLLPTIGIIEGSFLEVDFSEADIIYLACTTFTEELMESIAKQCKKLKKGSRVITLSKPMPSIFEPGCIISFRVFHNQDFVMTWGLEPVFFNIKE